MLDVSEMESEFGNDLDFLMARVSCCVEDKSVSEQYVVCVCACMCVGGCVVSGCVVHMYTLES